MSAAVEAMSPSPPSPKSVSTTTAAKQNINSITKPKKLRIRHGSSARYDTDFPPDQVWVRTSGKVFTNFIDENPELLQYYKNNDYDIEGVSRVLPIDRRLSTISQSVYTPSQQSQPSQNSPTPSSVAETATTVICNSEPARSIYDASCSSIPSESPEEQRDYWSSVLQRTNHHLENQLPHSQGVESRHHLLLALSDHDSAHGSVFDHTASPSNYRHDSIASHPVWPKLSVQEACLMRYFIDNLACWFDLCDPAQHFALVVPQRASLCPALLKAIYTASARHVSRLEAFKTGGEIEYLGQRLSNLKIESAIEYHSDCINHLVALSNDPEAANDENLFAASVILRFYEEVDEPFSRESWGYGLTGTQVFLDAQASLSAQPNTLRHNAFLIALRQEIYVAFSKQQPFRLPITSPLCSMYRTLSPAEDHVWAQRTIVHIADVLEYCYGRVRGSNDDYDALLAYNSGWERLRPASFSPLFEQAADPANADFYPKIWFLSDCHVTAVQHLDLAKILLTVHDPHTPRFGAAQRAASERIEAEVVRLVRRVCGIAVSNRRAPPAMNTACMAIGMCGGTFTDDRERRAMMDLLEVTDDKFAWPTGSIRQTLREEWGW